MREGIGKGPFATSDTLLSVSASVAVELSKSESQANGTLGHDLGQFLRNSGHVAFSPHEAG